MVPAAIVVLAALPLTANNKVDRRALPAPEWEAAGGRAPGNALEETLAAVFGELLGMSDVGAEDDFFALGGHSLLAARLVGRLRTLLGAELALQRVFDTPTVAGLARALEAGDGAWHRRPPLQRCDEPAGGRWPLSAAQARLWFHYRLEGAAATYNVPVTVPFR
jgi:hypothetical protein